MSNRPVIVVGGQWDDRRNTSRERPPEPGALRRALDSLAALRRSDPALVAWVEAGHPNLTEAEHESRFGAPYERVRRR